MAIINDNHYILLIISIGLHYNLIITYTVLSNALSLFFLVYIPRLHYSKCKHYFVVFSQLYDLLTYSLANCTMIERNSLNFQEFSSNFISPARY